MHCVNAAKSVPFQTKHHDMYIWDSAGDRIADTKLDKNDVRLTIISWGKALVLCAAADANVALCSSEISTDRSCRCRCDTDTRKLALVLCSTVVFNYCNGSIVLLSTGAMLYWLLQV